MGEAKCPKIALLASWREIRVSWRFSQKLPDFCKCGYHSILFAPRGLTHPGRLPFFQFAQVRLYGKGMVFWVGIETTPKTRVEKAFSGKSLALREATLTCGLTLEDFLRPRKILLSKKEHFRDLAY